MQKHILIPIFLFLACGFAHSHATINIENVASEDGYIDMSIYMDKESFINNKPYYNVRKIATQGVTKFPLKDMHEGKISIFVYHDENNDKKLNTSLFWVPKEGFGYSNDYIPTGRPKFDKTVIFLNHGIPINLKMNY